MGKEKASQEPMEQIDDKEKKTPELRIEACIKELRLAYDALRQTKNAHPDQEARADYHRIQERVRIARDDIMTARDLLKILKTKWIKK